MIRQRSRWRRSLFNVFAWTVVSLIAFPLLWMILTSLKPQSELFLIPPSLLPGEVTFEHYRRLLAETPFLTYMRNSTVLAASTTILVIFAVTHQKHSQETLITARQSHRLVPRLMA